MSSKALGVSIITAALLLVAAVAFVNYDVLSEAYGPGAPYYGRTTNMDKWSDPLPALLAVGAVVVLAAALLIRAGRRRWCK